MTMGLSVYWVSIVHESFPFGPKHSALAIPIALFVPRRYFNAAHSRSLKNMKGAVCASFRVTQAQYGVEGGHVLVFFSRAHSTLNSSQ